MGRAQWRSQLIVVIYTSGYLVVITGDKWDHTFHKWGYKCLQLVKGHNCSHLPLFRRINTLRIEQPQCQVGLCEFYPISLRITQNCIGCHQPTQMLWIWVDLDLSLRIVGPAYFFGILGEIPCYWYLYCKLIMINLILNVMGEISDKMDIFVFDQFPLRFHPNVVHWSLAKYGWMPSFGCSIQFYIMTCTCIWRFPEIGVPLNPSF